jgi:hypothetical protein
MPYVDDGLERLQALLRHREALGLWRLVVAATLTRAEQRALLKASLGRAAEVLREEDLRSPQCCRSDRLVRVEPLGRRDPDGVCGLDAVRAVLRNPQTPRRRC